MTPSTKAMEKAYESLKIFTQSHSGRDPYREEVIAMKIGYERALADIREGDINDN
jgi:hypothetical protein